MLVTNAQGVYPERMAAALLVRVLKKVGTFKTQGGLPMNKMTIGEGSVWELILPREDQQETYFPLENSYAECCPNLTVKLEAPAVSMCGDSEG